MLNKKILNFILLLLSSLIFLLSCSKENTANKKLKLLWLTDCDDAVIIKKLVKDFEEENQNIKIDLIVLDIYHEFHKLQAMIDSHNMPALVRTTEHKIFKEYALDISDIVSVNEYINLVRSYYVSDGKVIALPLQIRANGLIINKDLFKKAGVKYPTSPKEIWTWDEFREEMNKLRGFTDYPGLFDNSSFRWASILYQFDGSIWEKNGEDIAINQKPGIDALTIFTEMQNNRLIDPNVWLPINSADALSLFQLGKYGFYFSGNWVLKNYKDLPFEWGVTYLPKGVRRSSVIGCNLILAMKGSGQERYAKRFISFLARKKINDKYCEDTMSLSPRKDSPDLDYPYADDMMLIFQNEVENTPEIVVSDWSHDNIFKACIYLHQAIENSLSGDTPEQALNNLAVKLNNI